MKTLYNDATVSIVQSNDINDYKPILEGLIDDFGYIYYHAILTWCNIIDNNEPNSFWQVYLITSNNEVVGICGLYSQYENSVDELWLGWFGIIPTKRNMHIGNIALCWMKLHAKQLGCKKLMSYVDADGAPLQFYYRNGFKLVCSVKDYLVMHTELSSKAFECVDDHIIECVIE